MADEDAAGLGGKLDFLGHSADLPDPRQALKVLYRLEEVLLVTLCAMICGDVAPTPSLRSNSHEFIREMPHGIDVISVMPKLMMVGDLLRGARSTSKAECTHTACAFGRGEESAFRAKGNFYLPVKIGRRPSRWAEMPSSASAVHSNA
jgi:hypothetical protein